MAIGVVLSLVGHAACLEFTFIAEITSGFVIYVYRRAYLKYLLESDNTRERRGYVVKIWETIYSVIVCLIRVVPYFEP